MPTREEQKEARRYEILMVALDLFIKKGFGGTRIVDIAKAAGMSFFSSSAAASKSSFAISRAY